MKAIVRLQVFSFPRFSFIFINNLSVFSIGALMLDFGWGEGKKGEGVEGRYWSSFIYCGKQDGEAVNGQMSDTPRGKWGDWQWSFWGKGAAVVLTIY